MEAKKSINTSVEKKNILLDFILQLKTEHTLSYILQEWFNLQEAVKDVEYIVTSFHGGKIQSLHVIL